MKCFNEPWHVFVDEDGKDKCTYIDSINVGPIPDSIAHVFGENRDVFARRIVACVNACAGLDTALLENITMLGDRLKYRIDVLHNEAYQRDQLLAALELLADAVGASCDADQDEMAVKPAMKRARAAIAAVKGA